MKDNNIKGKRWFITSNVDGMLSNIKRMNPLGLILCMLVVTSSCTQIDNYMLGKDNTLQPKPLKPIQPSVNLTSHWVTSIGKPSKTHHYLKLKPVVQGNIIYTTNESGYVIAIDKRQGRVKWKNQLKHGILSGPSVAHGVVVVTTTASNVVVLDKEDGHQMWHHRVSSDVLSNVAIDDRKLVVKTIDGHLYAFDLKSGEKLWVVDHGAPNLILKASSSPIVKNNLVFTGYSDGRLEAVDINTGHVVWQRNVAYATGSSDVERLIDIDADPVLRGNILYIASYQGFVGALLLNDGQFIWNKPASVYKNFVVDSTTVFLVDAHDVIWAIDRQSGQVVWKQVSLKAHNLTDPVLMGNYLITGDRMGYLHVLSKQNGDMVGRMSLSSAIEITPAVSEGDIYVATADGQLHDLRLGKA